MPRGAALGLWLVIAGLVAAEGRADHLCSLRPSGADTIRLLNLSTGAPPSELHVGTMTGGVTLSADRRRLFIATADGLDVLDVRRQRVIDTVPLPVSGIIVATADDVVYFVTPGNGSLALRAIDVTRRTVADVVQLPDWAQRVTPGEIGDSGRLLFLSLYAADGTNGVAVIDLSTAQLVATWISTSVTGTVVAAPHPTRDVAYLFDRGWREPDRVFKWRIGEEPEPLSLPAGHLVFAPDGSHAYLVRNADLDTAERTMLLDTADDAIIAELPSGSLVAFADDDCVVLANGRELRRACPGAERSDAIDAAMLSPDDVALIDHNTFAAPAWTTGPCQAPPAACEEGIPCLEVLGATAAAGESVDVAVRLHTAGVALPGIQNDLFVDRSLAMPIAGPGRDGKQVTACRVNPDIGKEPSVFTCIEPRDDGCGTTRALVLSLLDVDPIPDGSLLYQCQIQLSDDVAAGRHRIGCATAAASDRQGNAVPIRCQEGELVVTSAPSGTSAQTGSAAAQGCQVDGAGASTHAAAWLLPALALLTAGALRRR